MFLGLAIIILGNGFLKPNISSFLGKFYQQNDPRRDTGFTIYYMVFNVGIALSTLSSGYIQRIFGWHVAFGVAAFGLILALDFFLGDIVISVIKGLPLKHRKWPINALILSSRIILSFCIVVCCFFLLIKISNRG